MRIQDLLQTELPIIQAPMAGVQTSPLAIAVIDAGGVGSLPAAMLALPALQDELKALSARGGAWNVNFFSHTTPAPDAVREARWRARLAPYHREYGIDIDKVPAGAGRQPFSHEAADVLEPFKPPIVSFHFGLPAPDLLKRVRGWGSRIVSSATTVDEALWLQEHGVDAVIAQGLEAGGHRGHFLDHDLSLQQGLLTLLPQIVAAVKVPVIAAGGIADANAVKAAMALGASAVQVGTAYMLCPEAQTSALHRAALRSPQARHTALTNLFTGRPARGIVNRLMRELGPLSADAPEFPTATAAIAPLRSATEAKGLGDFTPLWSGQRVGNVEGLGAAALTRALAKGL
ncbi:nitronate monooxygenase family protein [Piscinibacter sp. HJYY11]|uniref:NAD(P)H-dependent flavin oxidoreductase n=1 Tax=Piscinibacter sp. HJYY11 TaxID=2801333 RepID=UPI00191E3C95|nr:nitronate monooxygenase [Piscinibacter sp. HJYY11]MBL0726352.1 nitronate monooxygenase [Piscinibacter sp. HJYY11]